MDKVRTLKMARSIADGGLKSGLPPSESVGDLATLLVAFHQALMDIKNHQEACMTGNTKHLSTPWRIANNALERL